MSRTLKAIAWPERNLHSKKPAIESLFQEILQPAGICINGNQPWDIQVHNPSFYKRVLSLGSLGLGESYMDQWWDCAQLEEFFYRVMKADLPAKVRGGFRAKLFNILSRLINLQSGHRTFEIGQRHYDLGNNLFRAMLDSRMNYSCGYWKNAASLDEAQLNKLDLTCHKLNLKRGMSLLDIGCGWGGLAKYAAENYGVSVFGITVSQEQAAFAKEICQGLPVQIIFQDYRNLDKTNQQFDRIVSIGMFEHVGYKNYKTYMKMVNHCLKDNGLFLLHTIGSNRSETAPDEWVHKYIFPNSMTPSAKQISHAAEGLLLMEDWHNFGADYYKTLMNWYANFCAHWDRLKNRYDTRFYRMWTYYLLASAATFRSRSAQLWQIVFSKKGLEGGYDASR